MFEMKPAKAPPTGRLQKSGRSYSQGGKLQLNYANSYAGKNDDNCGK